MAYAINQINLILEYIDTCGVVIEEMNLNELLPLMQGVSEETGQPMGARVIRTDHLVNGRANVIVGDCDETSPVGGRNKRLVDCVRT